MDAAALYGVIANFIAPASCKGNAGAEAFNLQVFYHYIVIASIVNPAYGAG